MFSKAVFSTRSKAGRGLVTFALIFAGIGAQSLGQLNTAYAGDPITNSNSGKSPSTPTFTLSQTSETTIVNTPLTGYTITITGRTIRKYSISPPAPSGSIFNTSTGLLSGTPTVVAGSTVYTITATNIKGNPTQTFTLTVTAAVAAPAFSLSSSSETRTVNTAATGFTIISTGGAISSFSFSSTPAGMSFDTSTGALSGTPTSIASATAYTITATNATGSASATFTLTVTLAAPAFTLSSVIESKATGSALSGYTISSTGGAIASYAISPAAPAGLSFDSSTGLLSGTPTVAAGPTVYTITATNATGSASATFTLTVTLAAPAFTLSSSSETRVVNTVATGFTVISTGGAIASFSISSTPAGMSFDTSTGALSGTPTSIASATAYTITATNATGSATAVFTLTVTAVVYSIGDTGPGGGRVFYVALTPFNCGPTLATTCTYLEAAPTTSGTNPWTDAPYAWSGTTNTSIGTTKTAIGTGYENTLAMITQDATASKAGTISQAYRGPNNLTDWYLPSKDELNQMCKWARGVAWTSDATVCSGGTINTGAGAEGFGHNYYYSSFENNATSAWVQFFRDGTQIGFADYKIGIFYIRPVRAF